MAKRDTFMAGRAPYQRQGPVHEAAKFLRDTASRFLQNRANVGDLEVAITEFRAAVGEKGRSE